jgi:flagellar biosynthesis/type III secretory pathway protein FliH
MKDIKKLIKKIQKSIDKSWDDGYEAGEESGYSLGYSEGYEEGIAAHKEYIQKRLKASEELSLSVGKGTEAVRMREMAEFLAWEYDPEEAERQAKIADENGF